MKNSRIIGLFVSITLLFITCNDDPDVQDELKDAPKLTFTKLTVNKKDVTKEQLLQQIKEKEKEGFSIRRITVSDDAFAEVQGTAPNFSLKIKKPGTFTIKITLHKTGFKEVTIEATIVYVGTESLTFDKLSTAKSTLSKDDILKQVKGNKDGFTLKSIVVSDSDFAAVQGTAPNLSLTLKKAGDFTATIVLEKADYNDVTLNASFSGVPETLTFNELTTSKTTLNKQDLFNQIPEAAKASYALKSIVIDAKYNTFVEVQGTAPNLSLKLKKTGRFKADITLNRTDYLDVTITGASFNYTSSATLTFPKFKTDKKTLTKTDIFNQVQGDKTGYTITKIAVANASDATVNADNSLTLKKEGIISITLTLQKASTQKTVNGQIEYRPKPALTFTKLTTSKKTITQAEINIQIKGNKNGYTIKNIVVANSNFATVTGTAPNFSLALKRTGTFSATITLGRTNYSDVTLNASLEGRAENLSFNAFSITYGGTSTIANSVILAKVQGAGKANYTLKSISNISDDSVAEVKGTGNNSSISLKKAGSFTAALVLERNGYFDVTIPAASFTIQKAASKTLGFNKLSIDYKKIISKATLESSITGSDKAGYTIQNINNINPRDAAELTGAGLHIKKTGDFTARLTLVHAFYGNATVNASFTIRRGNAKNITFDKLTIPYQPTISKARLEQNLKGGKDGYTIKSISTISDSDVAELSGTNLKIKKAGDFTARLTLTHAFYKDTNVNASFTIQKLPKKTLGFTKLVSPYKNLLTRKDILEKVSGQKDGYTIKAISGISDSDVAELTGAGLHIKKAGSFTATLTLAHSIYLDATLTGAAFDIKAYSFTKLVTAYKQTLTKADIEKQVQELTGYTLKSISVISNTDIAALTGSTATALHLKKAGSFTATITMKQSGKADIVIPKAEFEIQKLSAQKLGFNALTASKKYLIQADILKQITGSDKAGYTLKAISGISDSDVAELSGIGLKIKKAGRFTATLTLEHGFYLDTTLTGAAFTITKLTAKKLTFDKLQIPYKKVVSEAAILQQIKGAKNGYTLKNISEISGTELSGAHIAEFTGTPKAALHLKKADSFTAKITLTHPLYADAEITGASFEVSEVRFKEWTVAYKKIITSAEIMNQVQGFIAGYSLKSISELSGADIAELTGTPKTSLYIKKLGRFTATLTLEKASEADITLTGAAFTITKGPAKKLTFDKLAIPYQYIISEQMILQQVKGAKTGYTFKNLSEISGISEPSGAHIAEFTGTPKAVLRIKKAGSFTAKLTFTHPLYKDAEITGAHFEINHPSLNTLTFSYKETITPAELSAKIIGQIKALTGYTLKSISAIQPTEMATLTGTPKTSLQIHRLGRFTADLIMQKQGTPDIALSDAAFEITRRTLKQQLAFQKRTTYKNLITKEEILAALTGGTLKKGYTLKKITNLKAVSGGPNLAELSGLAIHIKKQAGIFTADLVLGHPKYLDTPLTGATFEKEKAFVFDKSTKTITGITTKYKAYLRKVTEVTFPDQIEGTPVEEIKGYKIGRESYNVFGEKTGNQNIKTVHLPKNLKTIGDRAFMNFRNLISIKIPQSVTTIGIAGLANCAKLTSINLPSVTTLKDSAFSGCVKLTSINMPVVTTIEDTVFLFAISRSNLEKSLTIPASIRTIGGDLFTPSSNPKDYPNVIIKQPDPTQITSVNSTAFTNTYKILVPAAGLAAYKSTAPWDKWKSRIFAIPTKKLAFSGLTTYKTLLTAEDIMTQVTEISGVSIEKGYTLKALSGLQAVSGGPDLAQELSGLTIHIKKQEGVFTADLILRHPKYLDITITDAQFTKVKAFIFDKNNKTITGVTTEYKTYFSNAKHIHFPDQIDGVNVEVIKGDATNRKNVFGHTYNTTIQTIRLPKHLKTVGELAFYKCVTLPSITLPHSVTSLEKQAFSNCKHLVSVNLSHSLVSIGDSAFENCDILKSITIPNSVKTIGAKGFYGCEVLPSMTISNSVTSIGNEAFMYCYTLQLIIKQRNPAQIRLGSRAFSSTQAIEVPKGTLSAYQTANNWKTWAYKILESQE